jgi:hypothetical protein
MARFTCPECTARVKVPDTTPKDKRIRCHDCGALFDQSPPDSGRHEIEEKPRPRQRDKQGRSGARIAVLLIGGGAFALLALGLVVGGIVLIVMNNGGAGGPSVLNPGGLFGASKATVENYHKLARGMSVSEAEAILGPGKNCTINDFFQANDPTNQIAPALKDIPAVQNDPTTWRRWQNGGLDIFVNFRKGKSGVERVCAFYLINRLPGGAIETETQEDNPLEDLDAMAAGRAKNEQLLKDPRWKTGPAIRAALIGKWTMPRILQGEPRSGWDFNADGTCAHIGGFGQGAVASGTYRFVDDSHIETTTSQPDFFTKQPGLPVTEHFKVLVDDKELVLVYDNPDGPSPTLAMQREP